MGTRPSGVTTHLPCKPIRALHSNNPQVMSYSVTRVCYASTNTAVPIDGLSEAVHVYAAPDQDVCGVNTYLNSMTQ